METLKRWRIATLATFLFPLSTFCVFHFASPSPSSSSSPSSPSSSSLPCFSSRLFLLPDLKCGEKPLRSKTAYRVVENDKTENDKIENDKTEDDKIERGRVSRDRAVERKTYIDKAEKDKTEEDITEKDKAEKDKVEKDKAEEDKAKKIEETQTVQSQDSNDGKKKSSLSLSPSPSLPLFSPTPPAPLSIFPRILSSSSSPPPSPLSPPPSPPPPPPYPPWRTGIGEASFDPSAKYLFYPRARSDFMVGSSHRFWALTCEAGEALLLRRILVLDMGFGVAPEHNYGVSRVTRFEQYFDLRHLQRNIPIIDKEVFKEGWEAWDSSHPNNKVSVFPAPITGGPSLKKVQKSTATVIHRVYSKDRTDWAFTVCEKNKEVIKRPWGSFRYAPTLVHLANAILRDLPHYFIAMHVRRGDKVMDKQKWPNLDRDTRPPHLLQVLHKMNVSEGTTIYIATNEKDPNFFIPLSISYPLKFLRDYSYLWVEGSRWWNATLQIVGENGSPEFDGIMEGIVDYIIVSHAAFKIETFNDLTSDKKNPKS